ncbi:MAG: endonuclease/exonuclease/phosphatase family protein [Candidatus Micrarchaeaceae archaeon]
MRLVTLNAWCGKLPKELLNFVKEESPSTDVFCFQEVLDNKKGVQSAVFKGGTEDIVSQIREALPEFNGYSAIPQKNERGLATFISKKWRVEAVNEEYLLGEKDQMSGNDWSTIGINMLHTVVSNGEGSMFSIWNLHGKFVAPDKMDYPETIEQSKSVSRIIGSHQGKRILCGDLNLDPNTESIAILERIPLRNLVKEYGIKSTRTRFYELPNRFADYIMASNEIKVADFGVIEETVSDHLPLFLKCY